MLKIIAKIFKTNRKIKSYTFDTCPECGCETELVHGNNTKLCPKCIIGYYELLK